MFLRLLLDGHPLIAIHKGRYYRRGDGIALGPGPFVAALECCTDIEAEVVGKPEPAFFHRVLNNVGSDAQSTVMIGDVRANRFLDLKLNIYVGMWFESWEKEAQYIYIFFNLVLPNICFKT